MATRTIIGTPDAPAGFEGYGDAVVAGGMVLLPVALVDGRWPIPCLLWARV